MDIDDLVEPEVGVAVAVTAALASPSVRKTLRKGAAYGLAGLLLAGDAASKFVKGVSNGAKKIGTGVEAEEPATAEHA